MRMPNKQEREEVNQNIHILNAITPTGFKWTVRDIAEITGCSRGLVFMIEKSALKKMSKSEALKSFAND